MSVAETPLAGVQAFAILPRLHEVIGRSTIIEPHVLSFL
jgi:hypothetical protein